MRLTQPPRIATWLLEHLTPADRNEALAGDLLEEFRSGRSVRWYWRQVLGAIAIGRSRDVFSHVDVVLFAAFWAAITPAWLLTFAHLEQRYNLEQRFWELAWPWSTICELGLLLAANLLFTWTGIVLYLVPQLTITKRLGVGRLGRGVLASLPVLMTLWAALIILPMRFLSQNQPGNQLASIPISESRITSLEPLRVERIPSGETWSAQYGEKVVKHKDSPIKAIADFRISAMFVRLPFFFCIVFALWRTAPKTARSGRVET